jgi:hypothetical protein
LRARAGKRDELVAKFFEVADIQRDNLARKLMLVSSSPEEDDVVFLTEVWTAPRSTSVRVRVQKAWAWAAQMPSLVAGPPESTPLVIEGGKGLATEE